MSMKNETLSKISKLVGSNFKGKFAVGEVEVKAVPVVKPAVVIPTPAPAPVVTPTPFVAVVTPVVTETPVVEVAPAVTTVVEDTSTATQVIENGVPLV